MATLIDPTGAPNDPRIGRDQTPSQGTRRRHESDGAKQGTDAAKVTISQQAAVTQTLALASSENVASAGSSVTDINRASDMVKALAAQISAQPAAAHLGQGRIDPKVALNLLS